MSGSGSSRPVDGSGATSTASERRAGSQKRANDAGSSRKNTVLTSGADAGSWGCGSAGERGEKRQACGEGVLGVSVVEGTRLLVCVQKV